MLSDSFHGRDLFAPVATKICRGEAVKSKAVSQESIIGSDWPEELSEVIYVDHYGNLVTGLKGDGLEKNHRLAIADQEIVYARAFCEAEPGQPFWYVDSFGLLEISVNQGRANKLLGGRVGDRVEVISG
ncbi:SAM hydrolase/SAM-dependent halogenase family protein [Solemya velesiana gill symbiont]|uniref:SAM hydrolase/SAM-dependent halogenase family protein n=1 Tax=Solemya velesiana gill symbiont TaxID=1918948 RepID=UPI002683432E